MNNTNAIEKALKQKISAECREIVNKFINDLEELSRKYGGASSFYDFKKPKNSDGSYDFMVTGTHGVTEVLHRMILDNHGDGMLKFKSKELLNKLELI